MAARHGDPESQRRGGQDRSGQRARDILHELLRERGLARYGLFFGTGEGRRLPDGSENASGYVIDDRGLVFFYWLDWDDRRNRPTLTEWEGVEADQRWADDPEYARARQAADLAYPDPAIAERARS